MQIFVRSLAKGHIVLDLDPSDRIDDVMAAVEDREGVSALQQRLVFGGRILDSRATLSACGIGHGSILDLRLLMEGGKKKKRKKKSFTTKKRVPHVRRKEKLKLLRLFTINRDGSVEPQRKECENCPGCFLAQHKPDGRLYCGRCHTMIKE